MKSKFDSLPKSEQLRAARRIIGGLKRAGWLARGGYKTVHGPDQANRAWTAAETDGECAQLTASERNRLVALARNAARNSEHLEGALHQIEINCIGCEGGKAIFDFPPAFKRAGEKVHEAFADWARSAEYFSDLDLQDTLKLVLRTQILGGDLVLVFDNGITRESTGQIIAFEPDCIGNIPSAEFEARFPGCSQHQGVIKNANGKDIGVIVSWSQRGRSEYSVYDDKGRLAVWPLVKSVNTSWTDSLFTFYRGTSRFNQIRGNSRLWPGLATAADVAALQGYEVQSAKKGAQTFGQVLQEAEQNEADISAELDPDAGAPVNVDGEGAAPDAAGAIQEAIEDGQDTLDLDAINATGAIYDVMPPGVKMELFDTKHPNDKLVEFSKWLNGGVAFALGLGRVHSSGEAAQSYSSAMAEMLLSSVEFRDEFHKLEKNFLDWVLANWSRYAQQRGIIPQDSALPRGWRRTCVKWQRPPERAINPVDEQTAINSGLKNGTILYREKLGPDWRGKLEAFAEEIEFCRKHNIPHLALQTVSGGVIETKGNQE